MVALFIAYNQAFGDEVVEALEACGQRGYTQWLDIQGRGGVDGEPHLGNHAWPTQNNAILTFLDEAKSEELMRVLRKMDEDNAKLGLRAYSWKAAQEV